MHSWGVVCKNKQNANPGWTISNMTAFFASHLQEKRVLNGTKVFSVKPGMAILTIPKDQALLLKEEPQRVHVFGSQLIPSVGYSLVLLGTIYFLCAPFSGSYMFMHCCCGSKKNDGSSKWNHCFSACSPKPLLFSQESSTFSATRSIAWRTEKSAKIRGIVHEESRSDKLNWS